MIERVTAGGPRFSRRLTKADEKLGSMIVDDAGEVLPGTKFTLLAGGLMLQCVVAEASCSCPERAGEHRHHVLSAAGLGSAIDLRAGNVVVLRRDGGMVTVEESAYALG